MLENAYQAKLIKKLRRAYPGCVILKNDSGYLPGIVDLTILYRDRWAMLEVKKSASEPYQPNQEYYLAMLNEMSFAATIFPSNEVEILLALQQALEPGRNTRVPRRE